jgi:hypothetical protein
MLIVNITAVNIRVYASINYQSFCLISANNNYGGDYVKKILLISCLVLIIVLSLLGCQQSNGQNYDQRNTSPTMTTDQGLQGQGVQGGGSGIGGGSERMGGGI